MVGRVPARGIFKLEMSVWIEGGEGQGAKWEERGGSIYSSEVADMRDERIVSMIAM